MSPAAMPWSRSALMAENAPAHRTATPRSAACAEPCLRASGRALSSPVLHQRDARAVRSVVGAIMRTPYDSTVQNYHLTTLDGGTRVVTEPLPSVRSVAL